MKVETLVITENMILGIARLFEAIIFLMLGFELIQRFDSIILYYKFCLLALLACVLARAIVTTTVVNIINCFRREPINLRWQIIIFVGGLRGAVAYAMVTTFQGQFQDIFMTATVFVIIVTNLINGILTKPLVQCFDLTEKPREEHHSNDYKERKDNWIFKAFSWLEDTCIWPLVSRREQSENAEL